MPEATLDARVTSLEGRVATLEGMLGVVAALRTDLLTITQSLDPALTQHVAELDAQLEKHALLLGRLLEATPLARRRENDDD